MTNRVGSGNFGNNNFGNPGGRKERGLQGPSGESFAAPVSPQTGRRLTHDANFGFGGIQSNRPGGIANTNTFTSLGLEKDGASGEIRQEQIQPAVEAQPVSPQLNKEAETGSYSKKRRGPRRETTLAHELVRAAIQGEESAIEWGANDWIFNQSINKLFKTLNQTGFRDRIETLAPRSQDQLNQRLLPWLRRKIKEPEFSKSSLAASLDQFAYNIVFQEFRQVTNPSGPIGRPMSPERQAINERMHKLFPQALSDTPEATEAMREIQTYLESPMRTSLGEDAEQYLDAARRKLAKNLPNYLTNQLTEAFATKNILSRAEAFARKIAHDAMADEILASKIERIEPKQLHDIRYVFPEFPVKWEKEQQTDYELRVENFLQNIHFSISMSAYRVKLLSYLMQNKSYKEIYEALGGQHSIDSINETSRLIRDAFDEYIVEKEFFRSKSFNKPPYHLDSNTLGDAVRAKRCEAIEFIHEYYFEPKWVQEYLKVKYKRFSKRE